MLRLMSFLLLTAVFGFGGALLIMLAFGLSVLVIKLIPVLLVVGLLSVLVRGLRDSGGSYSRREYW